MGKVFTPTRTLPIKGEGRFSMPRRTQYSTRLPLQGEELDLDNPRQPKTYPGAYAYVGYSTGH
mgnify:CR=1 FL=1